jgi:hypothetical protein
MTMTPFHERGGSESVVTAVYPCRMPLPADPVGGTRRAFADESFREADTGGYYVVAAAVFEPGGHALAREVMRELYGRRRRGGKLHWNQKEQPEQRAVVKTLAELDALHVVTVGGPVPLRRQERVPAPAGPGATRLRRRGAIVKTCGSRSFTLGLGWAQQRFRRDARPVGALPADELALDNRDPLAGGQ